MSPDFLPQALVALRSMQRHVPNVDYYTLNAGPTTLPEVIENLVRDKFGITITPSQHLLEDPTAQAIVQKYENDQMRWSLKPCWLRYLLKFYDKVIYVDNDCYFINNFQFLFDDLDQHGVLLTPHWRSMKPSVEFSFNLTEGIFNAGFIGVNKTANRMLEWWANMCKWQCSCSTQHGFFVDQKYLDLVPVFFDDICKVVRHRGCNVASWNVLECKRELQQDGSILINGEWPIIFVHLSHWRLDEEFLSQYYKMYIDEMEQYCSLTSLDSLNP